MRLTCPSCDSSYEVPDALIGTSARRVRCVRCGHVWTHEPPQVELPPPEPLTLLPPPPLVAGPRHSLAGSFPEPARKQPVWDRWVIAAWAASLLAVAGMGVAAVQFRADLMHSWPPSQRLYAVFGAVPR